MVNEEANKGIRRKSERTENSNCIIYRFSLINYTTALAGILIKYLLLNGTAWDLVLLTGVAAAIVGQIIAYSRMKCSSCYGRFTMLIAAILFTMANIVFKGSIVLIVLMPMILMYILYMNKIFLNIIYGVWIANAGICLIKLLYQGNVSAQAWRDYAIVILVCVLFGVSVYMVNGSMAFQYAYVCSNLKKQNKRNKKFYEESIIDSTTGLMNRNAYNSYIKEYEEQGHSSMCCIYVDVNGLHEYNNAYGHQAGDKMLKKVAVTMKECFHSDKQYRIGGDEFVILSENSNFRLQMEELKKFRGQMKAYRIHIASGMEWRDENMNIQEMIKTADTKMYQDKERFYRAHSSGRAESILYKKAVD